MHECPIGNLWATSPYRRIQNKIVSDWIEPYRLSCAKCRIYLQEMLGIENSVIAETLAEYKKQLSSKVDDMVTELKKAIQ